MQKGSHAIIKPPAMTIVSCNWQHKLTTSLASRAQDKPGSNLSTCRKSEQINVQIFQVYVWPNHRTDFDGTGSRVSLNNASTC